MTKAEEVHGGCSRMARNRICLRADVLNINSKVQQRRKTSHQQYLPKVWVQHKSRKRDRGHYSHRRLQREFMPLPHGFAGPVDRSS